MFNKNPYNNYFFFIFVESETKDPNKKYTY